MAFPRSPRTSSAFQSTRSRVLDTTYFFAASIVRAKGSIQSGLAPLRAGGRHHLVNHPAKEQGIGPFQIGDGMAMQLFVRDHHPVIVAAVEGDVDRVPERSHRRRVLS